MIVLPVPSLAKQPLLWVVLAGLVIWGAQSYDSDLRTDNVLYASIAKQTLELENPLQLQWGHEPYLNKPPLFFWITAASMKLLGTTVFAAKLPTILFGIGCLILLYQLACRVSGDPRLALLAVLIAILTYPLNRSTNACRMESQFVFFLLLSLRAWVDYRGPGRNRYLLLMGASMGLAMLTKGPHALVPAMAILLATLLLERPIPFRCLGGLALATALAGTIGGSWYLYMLYHSPAFAAVFREQVVDRVAATSASSYETQSLFYYAGNVLKYYALFLPALAIGLYRGRNLIRTSSTVRLYLVFGVLYLVGVHLLATKYMRYLYPIYLLAAIPVAAGMPQWLRERSLPALQVLTIAAAVAMAVVPIPYLHDHRYSRLSELNSMAALSQIPVVATPEFAAYWESRSAALFFLDEVAWDPPPGPHFLLYRSPPAVPPGPRVLETRNVVAYAVVP